MIVKKLGRELSVGDELIHLFRPRTITRFGPHIYQRTARVAYWEDEESGEQGMTVFDDDTIEVEVVEPSPEKGEFANFLEELVRPKATDGTSFASYIDRHMED